MGKRFLYGTFVLTFGIWCLGSANVHASNLEPSNNDNRIEIIEGTGGLSGGEDAGQPVNSGDENAEILGDRVLEMAGDEPVKIQDKLFIFLDHIESGQASQTDLYNVLVSIYNLGLVTGLCCLMGWTYNMITSSFRRFIG